MVIRSMLAKTIEEDFKAKLPSYHKSRREGLTTLAALMLEIRSANLMELASALPREIGSADHRYQYIERQLKNEAIDADEVIRPYALQVIAQLAARGETVILQMDQSHIRLERSAHALRAPAQPCGPSRLACARHARKHRLLCAEGAPRQRARLSAPKRFRHARRRQILWNGEAHQLVSKGRLVLSHSPQGQSYAQ